MFAECLAPHLLLLFVGAVFGVNTWRHRIYRFSVVAPDCNQPIETTRVLFIIRIRCAHCNFRSSVSVVAGCWLLTTLTGDCWLLQTMYRFRRFVHLVELKMASLYCAAAPAPTTNTQQKNQWKSLNASFTIFYSDCRHQRLL